MSAPVDLHDLPDLPADGLRMRAAAVLSTELVAGARGAPRTRVVNMRSKAPLKLRPTIASAPEPWAAHAADYVRVCLAASAGGPVGGDRLRLDVLVGAGSSLVLTEASATLVLPGHDGAQSRLEVNVTVQEGGTFVWLPHPVIAAHGCHHLTAVTVDLAPDSRLLLREELVLGRRGEPSGRLRQRLRVRRAGLPVLAQDLDLGGDTSPAVTGRHGAVGSLLVVDPDLGQVAPALLPEDGALLPLAAAGAVLASGLSADSSALRTQLDHALTLIGAPWDPRPADTPPPRGEARTEPTTFEEKR